MLPEAFMKRMESLLGSDVEKFKSALEGDAVRGLRVNTLKCSVEDFLRETDMPLTKLEYSRDGFIYESDAPVGRLAEHHSGRIYMQDPGAMAPLSAIEIPAGARVIDLCAAPGGKSSQAAAMIGEGGFILSNEYVAKRAKTLVGNFERLGIKNAIVTSLDTARLCELFDSYFDVAIVDAPCSGEGMFRKCDAAEEEWSEENVEISAKRQREILGNAARLVRSEGYLIYSTCTYAPEENEMTLDAFLTSHPEFELLPLKEEIIKTTAPAIKFEGCRCESIEYARRFYPHIARGEGQFLAVMKKTGEKDEARVLYKDTSRAPTKEESAAAAAFFKESLTSAPDAKLKKVGNNLVLISHGMPPIPQGSVFMSGVLLGEVQKGRLIPSHQFFSAYGDLFKTRVELCDGDARLSRYLLGEEIEYAGEGAGYCVLTYKGTSLGGGKISSGRIKNHYPKGLRNRAF
ncbi:MAG: RsmF rRNA methyltransferase first C-terminal domain-containing protein [Clostridia bacterium]|nr:RsmF rRNA methyltransferase first C-terminal domain-containing protein [Clostridia bacterium]